MRAPSADEKRAYKGVRVTPMRATAKRVLQCSGHQDEHERLGCLEWCDKAEESDQKGERQRRCDECKRWYFPWELKAR